MTRKHNRHQPGQTKARLVAGPMMITSNGTTPDGISYTFHYAVPYGAALRWRGGPDGKVPESIRKVFQTKVRLNELPVDMNAIKVDVAARQLKAPYLW